MEIKGIYDASNIMRQRFSTPVTGVRKEAVKINSSNTDTIKFSSDATFRSALNSAIKEYSKTAKLISNTSQEKLDSLKIAYQGDSCPVTSMEISGAILNSVCGYKLD